MRKLKLQYFVHLMPRADSLVKTLLLGKIEGRRIDAFFRTVVLENTLEIPLNSKEIKAVNPKGNQP